MATSWRQARGSVRCCRRGSIATTRRCSTCSAWRARPGGRASRRHSAGGRTAQPRAGDADRAVPPRARGRVAGAADDRRASRRSATRHAPSCRSLRSRGASFFRDLAAGLRPRRRPAAARDRRAGRLRTRDVGWILRAACAGLGGARPPGASTIGGATSPAAGRPSRPTATIDARGGRRAPGVGAAPPLRRGVPAAAHPGDERRHRGASSRASTGGSKPAARSAAAAS